MTSVSRVIPLIVCKDITETHDFLVDVFGFESGGIQRDGDGNVVHGEVRGGDAVIWLHAVSPDHDMGPPTAVASSGIVVHVDDVDAHYRHASEAGATIDSPPKDQEYGQREYGARDPEGHRWWFATPLSPMTGAG